MKPADVAMRQLRDAASSEGFQLVGVCEAVEASGYSDLLRWIDAGFAGEMGYFESRRQAYRHPESVLPGVKSIVALAYPYTAMPADAPAPGRGRVARYAWSGNDYHDVLHPKLKRMCRRLIDANPTATARGVVDTAPLLEREIAQLAGLGWRAKNTLLIHPQLGSYFFLACVLTDLSLTADDPHRTSHCGTCTACLDVCPTEAFPSAGVLDATRCISYLTIEHRGVIPRELRAGIGDWLFGCDLCQEVCPWNRRPARTASREAHHRDDIPLAEVDLVELLLITDEQFRDRFRQTPLWRTRRRGVLRNAAIVLGNQRAVAAVDGLQKILSDEDAILRGAAAWALGKIATAACLGALKRRLESESDTMVRDEIEHALDLSPGPADPS